MRIEITKSFLGKYTIGYDCPHCGEGLNSPIGDAGKEDVCPNCRMQFAVPGVIEAAQIQAQLEEVAKVRATETERLRQIKVHEQLQREKDRAQAEAARERENAQRAKAQQVPLTQAFRPLPNIGHGQTRRCPFCAEEILAAAQKCKHCGEFLDGRVHNPSPVYIQPQQGQNGCSLVIIIALGIVFGVLMLALL